MIDAHVPQAFSHLDEDEANFVYNVEVLALPARKAATLAGMKPTKVSAPHVAQAREALKCGRGGSSCWGCGLGRKTPTRRRAVG